MKIVVLADLHIGAVPANILRDELEIFFNYLTEVEPEMIVIAGDMLDKKISFNSEDSKLALQFVERLTSYESIIRIIRGTRNHDLNQLNNFIHLEERLDLDFRIINRVTEEQIGLHKFLYVPEEYIENQHDYYKQYLLTEYSMVFGHGTFAHVGFVSHSQATEKNMKEAPVFTTDFFKANKICFGHIHNPSVYKNIYYTGSYSRWHFGEEEAKGFRMFDLETNKDYFIENTKARTFVTVDVNKIMHDTKHTIEEKINLINNYKNKKDIDNLRIKFNNTSDTDVLQIEMLKEYFAKNNSDDIKISITDLEKQKQQEENSKYEQEYSFIFNKEYSMAKTLAMYLEKHDNIKLDEDVIESLLNNEDEE